jgi:hypothetical protein
MAAAKTKAKQAKNDSRPRESFSAIGQLGLKAQGLVTQFQAQIGTRLSATFITAFNADVAALPGTVPSVITTQGGRVQLTAAQVTALELGYKLVKGIRTTVKGATGDKDVLLAYGVGSKTSKILVKDVTAAIQTILARVQAQPTEAAGFDIVAADVTALQNALAAIQAADKAQEAGRAAAPQTTLQRNATARRILAGVKKIAGAGMRTFPNDPTTYAKFEALVNKKAG